MRRKNSEKDKLLFLYVALSLVGVTKTAPVVFVSVIWIRFPMKYAYITYRFKSLTYFQIIFKHRTSTEKKGFNKPVEPKLGEFPFQASLMQLLSDGKSYHSFCGGSLIHPEWVLTAAHCIQLDETTQPMKPNNVYIALGSIYRSARGAQIIQAKRLTMHSNYLSTGGHNDVGLIRLSKRAKLSSTVKLIRLHRSITEDLLGNTAFLTGFGIINDLYQEPERLRKATFKIERYNKCYNDADYANRELCGASKLADGKACKGDSGGPLTMRRTDGKLVLIGVTSRLALLPFCRIGFNHSIYTKVSYYVSWISRVTGIDFSKYNKSK